jgi:hypothetical protein
MLRATYLFHQQPLLNIEWFSKDDHSTAICTKNPDALYVDSAGTSHHHCDESSDSALLQYGCWFLHLHRYLHPFLPFLPPLSLSHSLLLPMLSLLLLIPLMTLM